MAQNYNLTQTGEQVQGLLNQVTPNTKDIVVLKEGVAARPTTEQVAQMVVTALQNYSTTSEMQQAITDAVVSALSDYSTTAEMNTAITAAITSALANYSTTAQMNTAIATAVAQALVNYYTKNETDAKVSAEAGRAQSVEGNLQQLIISVQQSLVNYYLKTETYSKTEVNSLIDAVKQFEYVIAATLPTATADTMGKIYLIPSADPKTQNVKDEYITVFEGSTYKWEQIGSTAVDLSGYSTTAEMNAAIAQALTDYYTTTQIDNALAGKQNVLTFDNTPTAGSMNPVTSGGVKGAIDTESARAAAAEQGLQDEYDSLYALYEAASFGEVVPVAYNDWPLATLEEGKVYRVANSATPTAYSDYMYDGTNTILLATFSFPGIDNVPTAGSSNLVTSGGVQNELALGAVYDVSAKNPTAGPNNNGKWESLSALLSDANLNTLIPTAVRKGGMSIKFVQSSDNKYVQYFLNSQTFTTNTVAWEKVNLGLALGNPVLNQESAEQVTYHDISSDGSLEYTSSFRAYYFTNKNYAYVKATLGCNTDACYAIAFYNSNTPSSESFIGGVKTQALSSFDVSALVPNNCVLIIVSNRNYTNNNPQISIFNKPIVSLNKSVNGGGVLNVGQIEFDTVALQDEVNERLGKAGKTKDNAEQVTYHDILSNGNLEYTSSFRAYYYKNDGYDFVIATLGSNNASDMSIAFYNSDVPSSSSFISGVNSQASASFTVEGKVPDGCVLIIVCNRNNTNPNPVINIFKKLSVSLSENQSGGRDLMVGDYNAGTVAMEKDLLGVKSTADTALVKSYRVNDALLQEIRWGKIFDIYGNVYDNNRSFITTKFECKKGDVIKVDAHGFITGIVIIFRDSTDSYITYYNLTSERTIDVTYANASYCECAFLKTGYGATITINDITVFTYTQDMHTYLEEVYKDTFTFDNKIEEIYAKANKAIKNNSIVFVHLTDTHSGYKNHMDLAVAKRHMGVALHLAEKVNADFVVHTGDAIHGYQSDAENAHVSYEALLYYVGQSSVPVIWAQGNSVHDFGYHDELTRAQVNTIMGRNGKWLMQNAVYGDTRSFYYFDMSRTPCRVLVIDPDDGGVNRMGYGFSSTQITFIQEALSGALSNNLPVYIFAHMPLTGKLMPPYTIDGTGVESAISSFIGNGGILLGYSFGHTHTDNYYYDKPNGIPYINLTKEYPVTESALTQPEWGKASNYSREKGKLSEYAMDVYVVDVVSRKARIFRFGAGFDRISNVTDLSVNAGSTLTLVSELTAINWESLNTDIATVSDGTVTGVSSGDAEIIATDSDGNMEFFKVSVS